MDIFRSPATTDRRDSVWERNGIHVREERPLQPIRESAVRGSVDVVFRCYGKPALVVAVENADAMATVKTCFK